MVRILYGSRNPNQSVNTLRMCFEGVSPIDLTADPNTDELLWCDAGTQPLEDVAQIYPRVGIAYGMRLIWSWEMQNDKGYFDALQLEFVGGSGNAGIVFQMKVAASGIWLYEVTPIRLDLRDSPNNEKA